MLNLIIALNTYVYTPKPIDVYISAYTGQTWQGDLNNPNETNALRQFQQEQAQTQQNRPTTGKPNSAQAE
ncbi:MAG: hypothetical protein ACU837_10705 [Gammaproteobacteria bacterium]